MSDLNKIEFYTWGSIQDQKWWANHKNKAELSLSRLSWAQYGSDKVKLFFLLELFCWHLFLFLFCHNTLLMSAEVKAQNTLKETTWFGLKYLFLLVTIMNGDGAIDINCWFGLHKKKKQWKCLHVSLKYQLFTPEQRLEIPRCPLKNPLLWLELLSAALLAEKQLCLNPFFIERNWEQNIWPLWQGPLGSAATKHLCMTFILRFLSRLDWLTTFMSRAGLCLLNCSWNTW